MERRGAFNEAAAMGKRFLGVERCAEYLVLMPRLMYFIADIFDQTVVEL